MDIDARGGARAIIQCDVLGLFLGLRDGRPDSRSIDHVFDRVHDHTD